MSETEPDRQKPLPVMEGLAGEFYEWCRRGELRLQRCMSCGSWRHPPREMCPECGGWDWEWARSGGRGRVFSWTTATRALHTALKGEVPYAAVVVEMDEGVRLLSRVVDCAPEELRVDMQLDVAFEQSTPEVVLPFFRRADIPDAGKE